MPDQKPTVPSGADPVREALRELAAATTPKLPEIMRQRLSRVLAPRPLILGERFRAAMEELTFAQTEQIRQVVTTELSRKVASRMRLQAFVDEMSAASTESFQRGLKVLRQVQIDRLAAVAAQVSTDQAPQQSIVTLNADSGGARLRLTLDELLEALEAAAAVFLVFAGVLLLSNRESDAAVVLGALAMVMEGATRITRYLRGDSG